MGNKEDDESMCDREDSRREKHSMIKQEWKRLYIDTWKSLPVLKKISVCFGAPVITIAPIVLIILCLVNRLDKTAFMIFYEISKYVMMMLYTKICKWF